MKNKTYNTDFVKAETYLNDGHLDQAIKEFQNMVKRFPADAKCYCKLGACFAYQKKFKQAKECIEKAREDIMISTLELLEKRTSEILKMITNGKYKQVRFDKTSLKFKVFSDEKNDWVEPHLELSQATVEQIYLTAIGAYGNSWR